MYMIYMKEGRNELQQQLEEYFDIRIAVEHNGTQKAYGMKRNDDTTILYSIFFETMKYPILEFSSTCVLLKVLEYISSTTIIIYTCI